MRHTNVQSVSSVDVDFARFTVNVCNVRRGDIHCVIENSRDCLLCRVGFLIEQDRISNLLSSFQVEGIERQQGGLDSITSDSVDHGLSVSCTKLV